MAKDKTQISARAGKNEKAIESFTAFHDWCESKGYTVNEGLMELIDNRDKPRRVTYNRDKPSDNKILEFANELMRKNLEASEDYEKVAITMGYLRTNGGFNFQTTKRFLDEYAENLANHHADVGIEDPANWNKTMTKKRKEFATE